LEKKEGRQDYRTEREEGRIDCRKLVKKKEKEN